MSVTERPLVSIKPETQLTTDDRSTSKRVVTTETLQWEGEGLRLVHARGEYNDAPQPTGEVTVAPETVLQDMIHRVANLARMKP